MLMSAADHVVDIGESEFAAFGIHSGNTVGDFGSNNVVLYYTNPWGC